MREKKPITWFSDIRELLIQFLVHVRLDKTKINKRLEKGVFNHTKNQIKVLALLYEREFHQV